MAVAQLQLCVQDLGLELLLPVVLESDEAEHHHPYAAQQQGEDLLMIRQTNSRIHIRILLW